MIFEPTLTRIIRGLAVFFTRLCEAAPSPSAPSRTIAVGPLASAIYGTQQLVEHRKMLGLLWSKLVDMPDTLTLVGLAASACTSLSYIPQVRRAWPRNSTGDLSWKMLTALTAGLLLWIAYGFFRQDYVVMAANCLGASLSGCVLILKIRDMRVDQPPIGE